MGVVCIDLKKFFVWIMASESEEKVDVIAIDPPKQQALNVNEIWHGLEELFKCQLRKHVLSGNNEQFTALANEFGFTDSQKEFLAQSIRTYKELLLQSSPLPTTNTSNDNDKMKNVSGVKRRRIA